MDILVHVFSLINDENPTPVQSISLSIPTLPWGTFNYHSQFPIFIVLTVIIPTKTFLPERIKQVSQQYQTSSEFLNLSLWAKHNDNCTIPNNQMFYIYIPAGPTEVLVDKTIGPAVFNNPHNLNKFWETCT